MRKLYTRFSIGDLIIICLVGLVVFVLSRTVGRNPLIIAMTILGLSCAIFLLLWQFIIRALIERTIKKRLNVTDISSNDQIVTRYEDPDFWFLVLLVVLFVVIVPSFLLIFFGFGSVFITGIIIIVLLFLGTVISIVVPWPSRMRKRNLGFETDVKKIFDKDQLVKLLPLLGLFMVVIYWVSIFSGALLYAFHIY